jgi:hypothetical protein
MEDVDVSGFVTTASVLAVPMIYTFRLHKVLLLPGPGSRATYSAFVVLAVAGWIVAYDGNFNRAVIALAIAMTCPLIHTMVFTVSDRLFVRVVGHEPRDVFLRFETGYAADRIFALTFFFVCVFGSFAIMGPFLWKSAAH